MGIRDRYGRIGSEGREVVKTFVSPEEAKSDAQKLIDSKIKKGYVRK
ncbi:MAG: WGR domain-containing protein [Clostridiales bacterium]|nr:WGR domain-containing protein [Clostridiales bacterium]